MAVLHRFCGVEKSFILSLREEIFRKVFFLLGTEQIHELFGDKQKIVMATNNKYKKKLQDEFPKAPERWYPETEEEKLEVLKDHLKQRKFNKGHKRWKQLPEPIDVSVDAGLYCFYIFICNTVKPFLCGHSKIDKTKILFTNGSLMKAERIAECTPWSILQYF